jgi:hypothetical protein
MQPTAEEIARLREANNDYPDYLIEVPRACWPFDSPSLKRVWRSRHHLVHVYDEPGDIVRLSICRAEVNGQRWADGIPWDVLQKLKKQCGFGDRAAVEVFPPDSDVVNVANMRHLWVLPQPPAFMWRYR